MDEPEKQKRRPLADWVEAMSRGREYGYALDQSPLLRRIRALREQEHRDDQDAGSSGG